MSVTPHRYSLAFNYFQFFAFIFAIRLQKGMFYNPRIQNRQDVLTTFSIIAQISLSYSTLWKSPIFLTGKSIEKSIEEISDKSVRNSKMISKYKSCT